MRNLSRALGASFAAIVAVGGCSSADATSKASEPGPEADAAAAAVAFTITTQPASVEVPVGATATFTVTVTGGTAPVAYQWKRNGAAIAGATAASFTTAAAVVGDNGATFAVDVNNPAGMSTSATAVLTVSAGKAWGPPVRINSGVVTSSPDRPQVAIDDAGNAVAVWREQAGSVRNAAWASRYAAGGAWSPAATIDNPAGNSGPPRIAITSKGVAVASFTQSAANNGGPTRLWANRFSSAWGTPQAIDSSELAAPDDPQLALAPDGSALVVFLQPDQTLPRVWVTPSTSSNAWGPPSMVDGAGGALPEVALAASGHAVATWVESQGPSTFALWASRNIGAGWTAPVRVSTDTGVISRSIRVVTDAAGNATAVWSQMIAAHSTVRSARLDDATGAWSAPVSLSSGLGNASSEDVAADSKGNAIVVWNEDTVGVFANQFTASKATWSGPVNVAMNVTPPSVSAQPKVAIDGNGNAVAVWLQVPAGTANKRVYAAHFASAGGGWAAPFSLMVDPNAYTDDAATVAVNAAGEATAVWFQVTDSPAAVGIWARGYR